MRISALASSVVGLYLYAGFVASRTNPHVLNEIVSSPPVGVSYFAPKASHPRRNKFKVGKPAASYQTIRGVRNLKKNARSVAAILGAHQRRVGGFGYSNITSTTAYGTQFSTLVGFNNASLMLIMDTGSSDTWAIQAGFDCTDYSGSSIPQAACGFGVPFYGGFQYGSIPQQHMYIRYGDGEIAAGPMGYSDITLGNITVKKQEVCLANSTYWYGNNQTSGLLGLAYPALTNAYLGQPHEHDPMNQVQYPPVITNMIGQGLVQPLFSIAIDRNASSGLLAFGGIPPVRGLDPSVVASCDMVITNLNGIPTHSVDYSFYTIIPDGWQYGQVKDEKKYPYIVDTGTTLIYCPPDLAEAINAAFKPAAVYLWMYGAYFTACDAVAPLLAVILDGHKFWLNPNDLMYRQLIDPMTGLCMTAVSNGGSGPYILGDVFMQNALVVFDVGQAQMRFISREFY